MRMCLRVGFMGCMIPVTMTHSSLAVYWTGIIGCGRIADTLEDDTIAGPSWALQPYSHAGAYQRCSRTALVAAADPNEERRTNSGRRRAVTALYADYREMLERERLDIVSICVPTRAHARVAMDVAARGVKGIYLEKPIAQSLREATTYRTPAFRRHNVAVAVNHMRTWDPIMVSHPATHCRRRAR